MIQPGHSLYNIHGIQYTGGGTLNHGNIIYMVYNIQGGYLKPWEYNIHGIQYTGGVP